MQMHPQKHTINSIESARNTHIQAWLEMTTGCAEVWRFIVNKERIRCHNNAGLVCALR